jgi:GT2 family glycosyltransferase
MEDVDLRERAWGLDLPTRFIPEAVIDHPPRPDNIGKKLAPMHESEFMMFYKAGFRVPFRLQHLRRVAGARVRKYMHFRTHPEAWQILKSLYIESLHILRHGGEWERKYRKRYEGTQVRYPDDLAKRLLYRV